jgi:hypothetical protein
MPGWSASTPCSHSRRLLAVATGQLGGLKLLAINMSSLNLLRQGRYAALMPSDVSGRFDRVFCSDAPRIYPIRRLCCEILVNVRGRG